jgi:protein involved in polysaccharide export with SLBB domain
VRNPGILALASGARLVDAITAAGGYTPTADLARVAISHAGDPKPVCTVDLCRFLLAGDASANAALSLGDTVYVPSRESYVIGMVNVLGAVRQSGQHPITKGMTLREAVMLAGGPTELADPASVTLRHEGATEAAPIDYAKAASGDPVSNPELQPGDTVYFAPHTALGYYTIQGGVVSPGRYELRGETSVTEAIAIAGGVRGKVKLNNVSILRGASGTPTTMKASVGDIMAGKSPNVPLQNGDSIIVPAPREKPDLLKIASFGLSIAWLIFRTR